MREPGSAFVQTSKWSLVSSRHEAGELEAGAVGRRPPQPATTSKRIFTAVPDPTISDTKRLYNASTEAPTARGVPSRSSLDVDAKPRQPPCMRFAGVVVLLGMSEPFASANPPPIASDDLPHGFVWQGQESGSMVASLTRVAMASPRTFTSWWWFQRVIKTARDGRYHINFRPNTKALVSVRGALGITSVAATSHGGGDGETVDMHEMLEPASAVKLKKRPLLPSYTATMRRTTTSGSAHGCCSISTSTAWSSA